MSGPLLDDSVKWLGGEEVFAGEVVSEDDKPIQHTKSQDAVWFTLTIVGAPLLVLALGLVGHLGPPAQERRQTRGDAMRGALIHGVLLAVMLVYGYRTWTRDKTAAPTIGSVVLWDKTEADLVSIEYKATKKIVKLEHARRTTGGAATRTIETEAEGAEAG